MSPFRGHPDRWQALPSHPGVQLADRFPPSCPLSREYSLILLPTTWHSFGRERWRLGIVPAWCAPRPPVVPDGRIRPASAIGHTLVRHSPGTCRTLKQGSGTVSRRAHRRRPPRNQQSPTPTRVEGCPISPVFHQRPRRAVGSMHVQRMASPALIVLLVALAGCGAAAPAPSNALSPTMGQEPSLAAGDALRPASPTATPAPTATTARPTETRAPAGTIASRCHHRRPASPPARRHHHARPRPHGRRPPGRRLPNPRRQQPPPSRNRRPRRARRSLRARRS